MPEYSDRSVIRNRSTTPGEMEDNGMEKTESGVGLLRAARSGNRNGLNALHLAAKEGFPDIVEELIKLGADVNSGTKKGNTPLHVAALAGHLQIIKMLVENYAEVNSQSQNGFSPLYMAAQEGHTDIVQYFLEHGAKPALATEDGYTPLAVALQQGHDRVVSLLLENDDTTSKVKLPALHIAAKKDDTRAAALLLQKEMNPDVTSKTGFTALHIAAHYGNVNVAALLIEKGANVNCTARDNITPLHVASKWGKVDMITLLHSNGAVIDCKTRDSLTPLHCASRSGRGAVVRWLLEKGVMVTAKTKNGLSPLHMAAQGDHVDAARALIDHRAPIDDLTTDLLTPLHVAAHCGNVRVAKFLLDRGADVNASALNGFTALHVACKKNRTRIVELLLEYAASLHAATQSGLTPLHVAAYEGHASIVHCLIKNGAVIDAPTRQLETALHFATWGNHPEVVRILLRSNAQVDAIDREYQTSLHVASLLGQIEIAKTLLAHGANVDAETYNCWTALHMAARTGQVEIMEILLGSKASTIAETTKGFTPLHLAIKHGHLPVSKLLIENGVNVDGCQKTIPTPLFIATHYDREEIVEYLLEKGAPPRASGRNCYTPLHVAAKKNHLNVAGDLLKYGSDPNAMSRAGYTPLHLACKQGHTDAVSTLLKHNADPNLGSPPDGLTPVHLCVQEGDIETANVLLSAGAKVDAKTKTGYTPLHTACHFGQVKMVRFLLRNGARVDSTTRAGYTPLHQAAQNGNGELVEILLNSGASPNAVTVDGQTALAIGQRLGYATELNTLRSVTDAKLIARADDVYMEELFEKKTPETMEESDNSDWEEDGREDSGLSIESSGGDKQRENGLRVEQELGQPKTMDPADQAQLEKLIELEQHRLVSAGQIAHSTGQQPQTVASPASMVDGTERGFADQDGHFVSDNVEITYGTSHGGKISKRNFLISFLVDARGGAMRGCRHSGVRIIIPPRKAPMPMRITCRYLRKEKLVHPPPLSEGEALASRILEIGPAGARFLGPVILEIPHFAALRGREREIMIIRSDDGEHWKEHQLEATEDAVQEVLNESFDPEELSQLDDLNSTRITRILTSDFPQYFAVVTRVRQEVHAVGPEGGMIGSTVVPQVKAIFPEGALTKTIKVSLQAQPITQELVSKLTGSHVAVSPIVTVEPRRRKFHKPITLCIPLPQSTRKSIIALQMETTQATTQTEEGEQKESPTLRLLCSITGGTAPAKWEDITGTTQLAFAADHVSFTTTVSARFWLMDCAVPREAASMAQEIYNEAVLIPYMAKFVVFARRTLPNEWQLRVFCMTDDKEDKTLERQEHYTEIAKSRDVEVSASRQQYLDFFGNVLPAVKPGEQLNLRFVPFQENRLMFSMKKKDPETSDSSLTGKIAFMKDPRNLSDPLSHHHLPICTLAITLPSIITYSSLDSSSVGGSRSGSLSRKYRFSKPHQLETVYDTDLSIHELAREFGSKNWDGLGRSLRIPEDDIRQIQREYPGQETETVLRVWLERDGTRASGHNLATVLRQLGREDIVKKYLQSSGSPKRDVINGHM